MRVLAEQLAEDQRADAEGMLHRHLEADTVAGEAAETCAVIVLDQLRALVSMSADARYLQDHQQATTSNAIAAMPMTTIRRRNFPLEL